MKILTVIGARPQFIKAAVISNAISSTKEIIEIIVHTGQHYDDNMSKIFFDEMSLPEPINLNVGSGTHGAQTGKMLESIEKHILKSSPDIVLVYGDTNSTLAGALAAVKLHVKVAHVEAGLRSHNRLMPEEINRVLTDHCSDLLFAPTELAVNNLLDEGIDENFIDLCGDVMLESALLFGSKAEQFSSILDKYHLEPKSYILATIHRAENTKDKSRLSAIANGLLSIANEMKVVMPLHPGTRKALIDMGLLEKLQKKLILLEPVGYIDMLMLEKNSSLIVTDSGGIQKEAFFYSIPCVTLRDETEWIETVELGWNHLISPKTEKCIDSGIRQVIGIKGNSGSPYGDGNASKNIIRSLLNLGNN